MSAGGVAGGGEPGRTAGEALAAGGVSLAILAVVLIGLEALGGPATGAATHTRGTSAPRTATAAEGTAPTAAGAGQAAPLDLSAGVSQLTDDFATPANGWPVATLASGTTLRYAGGGYQVAGRGGGNHYVYPSSPAPPTYREIRIDVVASQTGGRPGRSSWGAACRVGLTGPLYNFVYAPDTGAWHVSAPGYPLYTLASGVAASTVAGTPGRLSAGCSVAGTGPDDPRVHVALAIQGVTVCDLVDRSPPASALEFAPSLMVVDSGGVPSTVTFRHVEFRAVW